ncbi:MAG TPA: ATP-binding protein [Myxococcales bacterium]|nr:ATP-binding protein [Myxococcales bacterium]
MLQRIGCELVRAPDRNLESAIDSALAELGDALGADRVSVARRDSNGDVQRQIWERRHSGRPPADSVDSFIDRLALEATATCSNRTRPPAALLRGGPLPLHVSAAIVVPLLGLGRLGKLAVTARTPRAWGPEAVKATEHLAEMLIAALDRMASQSSLVKEQEKRIQAEAETRKLRDQLAHAGRVTMLGELAASLAHELNQPLTAIYTNAQAAHRFLDRRPPALADVRAALHDLGQDCRRAGDVLGRLRQMFRRHDAERIPLAVGPLVEHVLKLLHEDVVARGIEVAVDIKPNLPVVNGDRVQLEQVLMNLLVNAFDAVSAVPGPRHVAVRAAARDGVLELSVLDSGGGIARSEVERIFDPFFTRKPNGMGMGLAICRTIAEAHGGRISARNRAERGAVFTLSLPARRAAETV